jgi:hypothetical protein
VTVLQDITINSGGQTGADRAALDFAIGHGLSHGGWCPLGRRAEDGRIPPQYLLRETSSTHYAERTRWNVRDSDATVVFSIRSALEGGTLLTCEAATQLGKPLLHLAREHGGVPLAAAKLRAFLDEHQPRLLNVAGPRASQEPEIGPFVTAVLQAILP